MEELSDKEFEAVKQLNGEYRQNYFEEKVRQQQGLYVLVNEEGPVLLQQPGQEDEPEANILPVFSHPRYLELFLASYKDVAGKPQFITLSAWNQNWVAALSAEQVQLGYMPLDDQDFVVEPIKAFD
ncbi:MAG: DUF2750 domain-containing protein [Succinivibrio sp.]|nr:DUF2750 domain-containing protein [Succinivibrio sp.]